jgi:hypothetical protein
MDIQPIIIKPISTPEYPDPAKTRRFITDEYGVYGYDYVFLEDATWNALCHIAREEDCTVDERRIARSWPVASQNVSYSAPAGRRTPKSMGQKRRQGEPTDAA